jgi:hypothetical protein
VVDEAFAGAVVALPAVATVVSGSVAVDTLNCAVVWLLAVAVAF